MWFHDHPPVFYRRKTLRHRHKSLANTAFYSYIVTIFRREIDHYIDFGVNKIFISVLKLEVNIQKFKFSNTINTLNSIAPGREMVH